MSVKDDLIAAKALIDTENKWRRGAEVGPNGEMCALRALAVATHWDHALVDAPGAGYLRTALPAGWWRDQVGTYNDDVASHADVMALFDRAIEAAS